MKTHLKWLPLIWILVAAALLTPLCGNWAAEHPLSQTSRPTLIIGDDINYPPYSYMDKSGKPAGFNIELARFVANAMGYNAEFRLNEWSKVRQDLEAGRIDVVSGMFFTPERINLYSFSSKHSVTSGDIFTRKGVKVSQLEDLRGKTVVVQKGDLVAEYLARPALGIRLVEVPTVAEALRGVSMGTYDYAGLLKLPGHYTLKEKHIGNIKSQGLVINQSAYCLAVKKGNDDLLIALNGGLQIAKATGDYQKIYDKWLGIYEEKSFLDLMNDYKHLIIPVLISILLLSAWVLILKHAVENRTKELTEANKNLQLQQEELTAVNEEMEASMEELMAIEEELREQYERLIASERNLVVSEERNKAIINAIPDILFILDRNGTFIDCQASNPKELFMPKEAFIGKNLTEVMPEKISKEALHKIGCALDTNVMQTMEYSLTLGGGKTDFELRIVRSSDDEAIGITRNITARKAYQDRIEFLSYHDQLTGLYNRRFFEETLLRLDEQQEFPLGIVMADVNGLKLINDSFGHQTGDELLMRVADVLKRACEGSELISRIGGDEFVILLPRMGDDQADHLIRRIKSICEQESVASISLSISFGWDAKRLPEEEIHEVFNRAEDFMYKKKLFEGPSMRGRTISAIINTLHEKNTREEQHSQRVSDLCRRLAEVLMLSERDIEEIQNAGLLHDIGKIAIHEYLLNKPGKLTQDEFEEIKRHPEIGYRILSSVNDMAEMADGVLSHHERWDGSGYPRGLTGEEIPLQARMIAIADAYDAITSERSYKKAMTDSEAVSELLKNAGTQFDPMLVIPFVEEVLGMSVTEASHETPIEPDSNSILAITHEEAE